MNVYEELAKSITEWDSEMSFFDAQQLVQFLDSEGVLDYDNLKEIYLYSNED